jgi:hypothetical protein
MEKSKETYECSAETAGSFYYPIMKKRPKAKTFRTTIDESYECSSAETARNELT